jgi:hypothetical protein
MTEKQKGGAQEAEARPNELAEALEHADELAQLEPWPIGEIPSSARSPAARRALAAAARSQRACRAERTASLRSASGERSNSGAIRSAAARRFDVTSYHWRRACRASA